MLVCGCPAVTVPHHRKLERLRQRLTLSAVMLDAEAIQFV